MIDNQALMLSMKIKVTKVLIKLQYKYMIHMTPKDSELYYLILCCTRS